MEEDDAEVFEGFSVSTQSHLLGGWAARLPRARLECNMTLDIQLFEMLDSTVRPFIIVFTKVDLVSKSEYQKLVDWSTKESAKFKMASPIVHFISSK